MKKNLLLTVDLTGIPTWQETAIMRQMADWIEANKSILPFDNLVILPTKGETRLYWLNDQSDATIKDLESIKEKLEPLLHVALDLKIDRKKVYNDPYLKKIKHAATQREKIIN